MGFIIQPIKTNPLPSERSDEMRHGERSAAIHLRGARPSIFEARRFRAALPRHG
jgi:hypothetical protein